MTTLAVTSVNSLRCHASTCLRIGSKLRCIRSTPTEMQSMSENDFECFASTGVNTPPMAKMTDDGQPGSDRDGKPAYRRNRKAVTYDIARSQVVFRSIPANLCDTVAAMWCLLDSRAKSASCISD